MTRRQHARPSDPESEMVAILILVVAAGALVLLVAGFFQTLESVPDPADPGYQSSISPARPGAFETDAEGKKKFVAPK